MVIKNTVLILFVFALIVSCTVKPQPIDYGKEACHYCKMNIIDRQHSAQLVSNKGKAFKFDAIECMLNHLDETEIGNIELFLVADFNEPGTLIDARNAIYIISNEIPSPMGEYLSALQSEKEALELQSSKGGTIYTWGKLLEHFSKE